MRPNRRVELVNAIANLALAALRSMELRPEEQELVDHALPKLFRANAVDESVNSGGGISHNGSEQYELIKKYREKMKISDERFETLRTLAFFSDPGHAIGAFNARADGSHYLEMIRWFAKKDPEIALFAILNKVIDAASEKKLERSGCPY